MGIIGRALIYGRVAIIEAKELTKYQKALKMANEALKDAGHSPMTREETKAFKATYDAGYEFEKQSRDELERARRELQNG